MATVCHRLLNQMNFLALNQGLMHKDNKMPPLYGISRMSLLDEENKRLLERSLELTSKVSALERALRSVHHTRSLEVRKCFFTLCLQQKRGPPPPAFVLSLWLRPDLRSSLLARGRTIAQRYCICFAWRSRV